MILVTIIAILGGFPSYPYSVGVLLFPHDEGAHYADTVTSEWWYVNMDLVDNHSDSFGIMLTHFRKPAVARIFNITYGDSFYSNVNILGTLRADTGHTFLTYRSPTGWVSDTNRWTYPWDSIPFSYIIKINDGQLGVACSLNLMAFERPFAIDSTGIVVLGDSSNLSYYYVLPFINVHGRIDIGNERHDVHGLAWIDRQWGPFYVTPQGGYEWFSSVISQDSQWIALQIWNLFMDDSVPHSPDFRHLNIFVHGDDTTFQFHTSQFVLERLGYFYDSVSQKYFSHGWRVLWQSDSGVIFLEMFPELEDQITTFLNSRFYEGISWISRVSVIFRGGVNLYQPVKGYGFAELVQKYNQPIEPPEPPQFIGFQNESDNLRAVWHPAVGGTYPVAGYRVYFLDPDNLDIITRYITVTDTFIDIPEPNSRIAIMLSAFDSSSAVSGSGLIGPFVFTGRLEEDDTPSVFKVKISQRRLEFHVYYGENWNIKFFTPDGRMVKSFSGEGYARLKLTLKTGVYFAVFNAKNIKISRKILIIR